MYNPFAAWPISCDWTCHIKRGSRGGTDYAVNVGTRVPAPFAGKVRHIPYNGLSGHTTILERADGIKFYFLHLYSFVAPNGATVAAGDILALSGGIKGAPGSGSSTGPHLHVHAIDRGVVHDFRNYLTTPSAITPLGTDMTPEENYMLKQVFLALTGTDGTLGSPFKDNLPDSVGKARTALQTLLERAHVTTISDSDIERIAAAVNAKNGITASELRAIINQVKVVV